MSRGSDNAGRALIALRNKFAEDLEEILQCPVCYESLSGTVPMCLQGHHVCAKCQPQMLHCPYCKSDFNGTRNYLAENLMTKFEEIKISLIDPKSDVNKKAMTCVQTQTDLYCKSNAAMAEARALITDTTNENTHVNFVDFRVAPTVGKGKYPCRIGNCYEELPHGRMIPHLRYYHKDYVIEEKISDSSTYKQSWELNYILPDVFQRAINIPNMGLFFLNISINSDGDLYGNVQIVNTAIVAQQFQYILDVINTHSSTSYRGTVIACRTFRNKIHEKSLFVNNLFMAHLLKRKQAFTCKLTITRLPEINASLTKLRSHIKKQVSMET